MNEHQNYDQVLNLTELFARHAEEETKVISAMLAEQQCLRNMQEQDPEGYAHLMQKREQAYQQAWRSRPWRVRFGEWFRNVTRPLRRWLIDWLDMGEADFHDWYDD